MLELVRCINKNEFESTSESGLIEYLEVDEM